MDLLSDDAVEKILQEAVKGIHADKVLVVIPDATRTTPVPLFFRLLSELLQERVEELVFLIALGTHPLMSEEAIDKLMGMEKSEREKRYPKSRVVNHRWDLEDTFVEVGRLTEEETSELSGGRLSLSVPIRINKLLRWADQTPDFPVVTNISFPAWAVPMLSISPTGWGHSLPAIPPSDGPTRLCEEPLNLPQLGCPARNWACVW
ncbi:MAG TPA: DUF2088 domain-containing protein [Phycisphaerales bacterium]|nr:DUF2088 domain-containing protein [Phycisphaerales bacterium]